MSEVQMKPFWLERVEDESGVSGVGLVAEGVVFSNGWCALTWLTEHTSVAFYQSIEEVAAIHGHDGKTKIVIGTEIRSAKESASASADPRLTEHS
jgi:hypothetical protein